MKRTIQKLIFRAETVRNLTPEQMAKASGGALKLSAPTDEMGVCDSCPASRVTCSFRCTDGPECMPVP